MRPVSFRIPGGPFRIGALFAVFSAVVAPAVTLSHPNARFFRGDISVSTSWEGIVRLTGTVVIREGVTVTVEPGAEILIQPGVGADIVVRGRLLVRGVPERPVLFDTAGGCAAGPWGGIVFRKGATGILEHAKIRCSSTGIAGDLSGVTRSGVAVERGR
ncbi:MAG: hypothetical protein HZA60_01060 [Deltaproteobacteria bacterium]|nr:hypothetical protein [Deltaproteobacteria bacterium]